MADVEQLRTKILEQFKNDGKKPQKQEKKAVAEKSAAPAAQPNVAMDDCLMGQMLEHQQRTTAVNTEAQKTKRSQIKEVLDKSLMKSLFRSM